MTIYDFMSGSPVLTFFLAWFLCNLLMDLVNLPMRYINMWKNGYPPPHCDVDGNFKKQLTKEKDDE